MENTIEYKGKTLTWDYKIVPCLECPIYPTIKDWEEEADKDIRKDKCYTSRCKYNKALAGSIAWEIHDMRFGY